LKESEACGRRYARSVTYALINQEMAAVSLQSLSLICRLQSIIKFACLLLGCMSLNLIARSQFTNGRSTCLNYRLEKVRTCTPIGYQGFVECMPPLFIVPFAKILAPTRGW